jgi:hypothetical protein
MQVTWRIAAFALAATALGGCADTTAFWKAEAPGAAIERNHWWAGYGGDESAIYADPKDSVAYLGLAPSGRGTWIYFAVRIDKNLPAGFDPTRAKELSDRHIAIKLDRDSYTITTASGQRYDVKLDLPFGDATNFVLSFAPFYQRFHFETDPGDGFDVDFPAITFDGSRVEIAPLRFRYIVCLGDAETSGQRTGARLFGHPITPRPPECPAR